MYPRLASSGTDCDNGLTEGQLALMRQTLGLGQETAVAQALRAPTPAPAPGLAGAPEAHFPRLQPRDVRALIAEDPSTLQRLLAPFLLGH
jgi:hypothetical protein